jgi:hypothetical protein
MVQRIKVVLRGRRTLVCALTAAALAVPAFVATAASGSSAEFSFTGTYQGSGVVQVTQRGELAIQHGVLGPGTSLACADGAVQVADLNRDGAATLADVQPGDTVLVLTDLPLANPLSSCYARLVIDQTHPPG